MGVTIHCLCHDCAYNKKARCEKQGGITIQNYLLGPMCEDFKDIYDDIHEEAVSSLSYDDYAR